MLCALLAMVPAFAEEATHKKVQAALDWELPVNSCTKPRSVAVSASEDPGQGGKALTDVDSYTLKRYERKEKRWNSCVKKYKDALMDDFSELKDSAQYGLTKPQADIILAKMGLIQSVYMSADGIVEATTE